MRQRFGIAQALLGNPRLIIVDEPTAGLDPAERNRFLNLLAGLGQEATVILSTHIVEDGQELCHQMAIINKGEVLLTGYPLDAVEMLKGQIWKKRVSPGEVDSMHHAHVIINERMVAGEPVVYAYGTSMSAPGFVPVEAGLEDVYFTEITDAENRYYARRDVAVQESTRRKRETVRLTSCCITSETTSRSRSSKSPSASVRNPTAPGSTP